MRKKTSHVILIPGLFGFGELGSLSYFQHVRVTLQVLLDRRGVPAQVHSVRTLPTGSIRRRALRLQKDLFETCGQDDGPIMLVGHSTGGLDARLLVTPGVSLGAGDMERCVIDRVRCVITLNTPHHGTPIAGFFTTLYGKRMLYLLSLVAVAVVGGRPGPLLASALTAASRVDQLLGLDWTALGVVADRVLREFTPGNQKIIRDFLRGIVADQGALLQLTPESMDLFNAAVTDHPAIDYLSYATAAPAPGVGPMLRCLTSPGRATSHFVYRFMFAVVGRPSSSYPWPTPSPRAAAVFRRGLGAVPGARSSDGVVPTLSMPWGELVMAQPADHLDVVGHFEPGPELRHQHYDWLSSGANFRLPGFDRLWGSIADQVASRAER